MAERILGVAWLALALLACESETPRVEATRPSDALEPSAGSGGAAAEGEPADVPRAPTVVDAGSAAAPVDAPDVAAPAHPPDPEPAGQGADAPWDTLLEGEWELPAGTEGYRCVRRTLTEDLHAGALKALHPSGTHHTVLTIGPVGAPDGVSECAAGVNSPGSIFGAGVGTEDLVMPDGVAMRFAAGEQLLLNLNLFNTTDEPLTGTSGTLFRSVPADEVEHLAERTIVVSIQLNLPPGEITTHQGQCTMTHDVTVFALLPHMHQLGTHLRGVADARGATGNGWRRW